MKIVHISPSLYTGGGEKFAVDMCNGLADDKTNKVILIILEKINKNSILKDKISKNVQLITMNKEGSVDIKVIYKLYKTLKLLSPDIVHTHLRGLAYGFIPILLQKIPVVHTVHNLAEKEAGKQTRKIYNILFNKFNIVPVAISDLVSNSIVKEYGVNQKELIYNGVEPLRVTNKLKDTVDEINSYKFNSNTKVLLNIGRISKQKNHSLLLDLCKIFELKTHNMIIIIIGPKTTDNNLFKMFTDKINKIPNIYYIGEKSNISDYVHESDALCISSLYEGLPLVVLEAMSLGKPILSTPAGGIPDVINSLELGLISTDFSTKSYQKIFEQYSNNYVENKDKIIDTFKLNYNINICINKYINLYNKVIKNA